MNTVTDKQSLSLYSIFHLNIMFSSIEVNQRSRVVEKCYWPLLHLIQDYDIPIGIEASGLTLETIATIDKDWLVELRRLIAEGFCEFVGSGYAQIVGPLVPAKVNEANLQIGQQTYEQLIGFQPRLALVNEQAYSAGLIQLYLDAGFHGIIMEWNNPYRCHPHWDSEWHYLPQIAQGQYGEEIPLIWNDAIAFQKFQRYVHGEMRMDEYLKYLSNHLSHTPRVFPLYGNDVEIFDFRPGRYHTEAGLGEKNEWARISKLFESLISKEEFNLIAPSKCLDFIHVPKAKNQLKLESVDQPIAVKKQDKYNITRWAVTGHDDLGINSTCYRIYELIAEDPNAGKDVWQELCYLWSSDFRTHITQDRWRAFEKRLCAFERKVHASRTLNSIDLIQSQKENPGRKYSQPVRMPVISDNKLPLRIETDSVKIDLNCRRGLAFDGLWFKDISDQPLIGTLQHGFYDNIALGADFYTGHLVLESPGQPKITDLTPVQPVIEGYPGFICISATVESPLGAIDKRVRVYKDDARVDLAYEIEWTNWPKGSLRCGYITLNPLSFDKDKLCYCSQNGGHYDERFHLNGVEVDHGKAVSFLVSAGQGIGITNGVVKIGDVNRLLKVEVNKTGAATIGLVTYKEVDDTYFYRLALSLSEMDDTRRSEFFPKQKVNPSIEMSLSMESDTQN